MKTVGILLAGGLSRRFGTPKAFAELQGKAFYAYVYDALDAVCDHIVIITRPELMSRFPREMDVLSDDEKFAGMGPLAGIYTAMNERPAQQYLVLPCDMPFVSEEETKAFMQLVSPGADITSIRSGQSDIPLFSLWKASVKLDLESALKNDQLRVMEFMAKKKTDWLDSLSIGEPAVFRNINKPDHLKGADDFGSDASTRPI